MLKDDKLKQMEKRNEKHLQFAICLLRRRLELKLNQRDVCKKFKRAQTFLTPIENGRQIPSAVLVRRFVKLYGMDEEHCMKVALESRMAWYKNLMEKRYVVKKKVI